MPRMDPYSTLGVSKSATQDEIKDAYRKLAKKLHPDLNPGNKAAEKQFKEVSAAYEILGEPKTREKYDRGESEAQFSGGGPRQGPFYYETQQDGGRYTQSFDEDLFKHFGDLFGRRRSPEGAEAHDELRFYRMDIDFKDAIIGATREVTLPDGKTLQIKIPAGVVNGQRLRLKGQGEIELHIRDSNLFHRAGKDITIEVPVSLSEAVLGSEIRIPTVDGAVLLKIPPGSNTGTKLRVRGKGVRSATEPGDEIVSLTVILPEVVDPQLREAIANWSQTHSYNPRERLDRAP